MKDLTQRKSSVIINDLYKQGTEAVKKTQYPNVVVSNATLLTVMDSGDEDIWHANKVLDYVCKALMHI